MAAEQQGFSGDAVQATLTVGIDSVATTFEVSSVAGWPASGIPFTVTLDQGNPILQETIFVLSYLGTTLTLDPVKGRGYDNTTAQSHSAGASVVHTVDAEFLADLSARAFALSTLGDIPYVAATAGVAMGRVPIGTNGEVLQVVAGVPAWVANSSGNMDTSTYDPAAIAQQVVGTTATQTLTNKRVTKRTLALSSNSATPAINTDNYDVVHITAQTATITGFTMTGTPVDGDTLRISITGTASVPFTLGSSFEASTQALSTTTTGTNRLDMGFFWNTEKSKWRQVSAA